MKDQHKHVMFVYDALRIGGCERVITVLAKEFLARGYRVTIFLIKKNIIEYDLPKDVEIITFQDYPDRLLLEGHGLSIWLNAKGAKLMEMLPRRHPQDTEKLDAAKGLWRLYRRYCGFMKKCFLDHPDATVIAFMDNPNFATLLAVRNCKNKVIVSERSHPGRDDIQPHFRRYRDHLYAWADLVVFQSEGARAYYPQQVKQKSIVIRNPVLGTLPQPYTGQRKKEIITFCRIDRQKNLFGLVRSFQLICEKYPDYHLAIYGKGDQEEPLAEYIRQQHLADRVFLRPHDSHVHKLVRDAAMFVSFADYEGISNSMLEAMALGMPVVCTDCPAGGTRMMIRHNINGLLVPVGDEEEMARAMEYMILHPEQAREMGMKASEIRNECSPQRIADEWMAAIDRLYRPNGGEA